MQRGNRVSNIENEGRIAMSDKLRAQPPGTALIGKAVDVLEAISQSGGAADHATLAQQCGLSRPTLYRILQALSARGLVRASDGRFALGYGLLDMAAQLWASFDLSSVAADELRRLRDLTGETSYLAVMDGSSVLSIGRFEGAHSQRSSAVLGTLKPLHCTSQGKAILAHLSDDQKTRLLPDPLPALTERTITDRRMLDMELARTRARGYALDDEEIALGTRCVGAAVLNARGVPVAAISVAGPSFRMTAKRAEYLGPEIQDAAAQIAARIAPYARSAHAKSDAQPLTVKPGFHGIAPHWDTATGSLLWADRFASGAFARDAEGQVTELARFEKRIEAMALTRAVGPAIFLETEIAFPMTGKQVALSGCTVSAACCDRQDQIWIATSDDRLGKLRPDGTLTDSLRLPATISAMRALPDGALLLVSSDSRGIYHFAPDTRRLRVFAHIPPAAGSPSDVACLPDGSLWLSMLAGWAVLRLNDVGEITQSRALPVADATGLCVTADASALIVTSTRHMLRREDLQHAPLSGHIFRLSLS